MLFTIVPILEKKTLPYFTCFCTNSMRTKNNENTTNKQKAMNRLCELAKALGIEVPSYSTKWSFDQIRDARNDLAHQLKLRNPEHPALKSSQKLGEWRQPGYFSMLCTSRLGSYYKEMQQLAEALGYPFEKRFLGWKPDKVHMAFMDLYQELNRKDPAHALLQSIKMPVNVDNVYCAGIYARLCIEGGRVITDVDRKWMEWIYPAPTLPDTIMLDAPPSLSITQMEEEVKEEVRMLTSPLDHFMDSEEVEV